MLMENLGNRNLEQGGSWTQGIFIILKKKSNVSPSNDLFASRFNTQLPEFVSYQPDPESYAANAFTQSWADLKFDAFPPFICLPSVIQKICQDREEGILVVLD